MQFNDFDLIALQHNRQAMASSDHPYPNRHHSPSLAGPYSRFRRTGTGKTAGVSTAAACKKWIQQRRVRATPRRPILVPTARTALQVTTIAPN